MTLLNTVVNFGGIWPNTLAFTLVDLFTWKQCSDVTVAGVLCSADSPGDCTSDLAAASASNCIVIVDGYYVTAIMCLVVGALLVSPIKSRIQSLQHVDCAVWRNSSALSGEVGGGSRQLVAPSSRSSDRGYMEVAEVLEECDDEEDEEAKRLGIRELEDARFSRVASHSRKDV